MGKSNTSDFGDGVYDERNDMERYKDRDGGRDIDRERRRDRRREEEEQNADRWERPREYDIRHDRNYEYDQHEPQHEPSTIAICTLHQIQSSPTPPTTLAGRKHPSKGCGCHGQTAPSPAHRPLSFPKPHCPGPPSPQLYHSGTPSPLPAFRDIPPDS